jgi:hypothetical protein
MRPLKRRMMKDMERKMVCFNGFDNGPPAYYKIIDILPKKFDFGYR